MASQFITNVATDPCTVSASEHMEAIRTCAKKLSDAIRAANAAGISVSLSATADRIHTDAPLFEIVYLY